MRSNIQINNTYIRFESGSSFSWSDWQPNNQPFVNCTFIETEPLPNAKRGYGISFDNRSLNTNDLVVPRKMSIDVEWTHISHYESLTTSLSANYFYKLSYLLGVFDDVLGDFMKVYRTGGNVAIHTGNWDDGSAHFAIGSKWTEKIEMIAFQ